YGVPSFVWATRSPAATVPVAGIVPRLRPNPEQAARDLLARLAPYYALDEDDVRRAPLRNIHDTGRGGIIVSLRQEVDGIEVFGDEVKSLLARDLQPIAISGSIPGKADQGRPGARAFRLGAAEAIGLALDDFVGSTVSRDAIQSVGPAPGGYETHELRAQAVDGVHSLQPIRSKRVFFHLPGRLVPGYYVELMGEADAVAYVVSASDGSLLFRHSLMESDAFSYRVWADNTPLHAPWDGPQGSDATPHPVGSPNFYTGTPVPTDLITLESGPISTGDPWLPINATETNGNNVDAYADLVAPDGLSAGDFRASRTGPYMFDRTYHPNLEPGATPDQQMASVTQLFYTNNFLHDCIYDAAFTEP